MLILKLKLFFAKHKVIRAILLIIAVCIGLSYLFPFFQGIHSRISDTTKGVIGTLLGAVIGGTFTLLGTIWIQQRQARIKSDFHRSTIIYKPLYDELKEMHDVTLIKEPFPQAVLFSRTKPDYFKGVCYEVWCRIKADSRYLETPDLLKKQIEKLIASTKNYTAEYKPLIEALDQVVSETNRKYSFPTRDNGATAFYLKSARFFAEDILKNKNNDCNSFFWFSAKKYDELNTEQQSVIDAFVKEANEKCQNLEQVKDVREKRSEWDRVEKDTIDLLACMIQYSNARNEG